MKKLLLVSTAIAGMALVSSPASAAIDMDLGGFFRGYGVFADNNEPSGSSNSLYNFEFRRDTEIHANGETTLDNGLTIGAHGELKIANGSNSTYTDEIYAYASGGWGRINFGSEDGAAYLLQVAAPSADSNIDGLRTNIQAFNEFTTSLNRSPAATMPIYDALGALFANTGFVNGIMDYDHADFKGTDRITYLTPKFDGFQGGISFAPKDGLTSNTNGMAFDADGYGLFNASTLSVIMLPDDVSAAEYKNLWEVGVRYDGEFEGFGIAAGAGYSDSTIENAATADELDSFNLDRSGSFGLSDGLQTWNGGLSIANNGFSLGGSYKHTETSYAADTLPPSGSTDPISGDITGKTWVIGLGYDNGPWHAGASYQNDNLEMDAADATGAGWWDMPKSEFETDKYTVGGGYTFGPGMTFRGSVAWGEFDDKSDNASSDDDNDFTQIAVGADIQF